MSNTTYPIDNPYQAPESELIQSDATTPLFVVSTKKLFILYITTFGMYGFVWFYQHYKEIRISSGSGIQPALRSLFSIFFAHNLFKRIHTAAKAEGAPANWSHMALATAYVAIGILWTFGDLIAEMAILMGFVYIPLTAYILCQVQATANAMQNDDRGTRNARFTILNILWSFVGLLAWLVMLIFAAELSGLIPA